MKRIGLVIPSLQSGGMERVMSELAKYFADQKKVEVHLVLYGKKNREVFFPVPNTITIHRPQFVFTEFSRMKSTLKTLVYLRQTLKRIKPDTVLSFGEYWNNFVLLSLTGLDIPIFVSDRCQPDKSLGRFHDFLRKRLYPKAAGIIAQTTKAKEIYDAQCLNLNIRVIGNPIYQISENGESTDKENIILTVGRLIKTKHHDRLIKIIKKLSQKDWKLVIIGDNALKQNGMERLQKLVNGLEMNQSVIFTGSVADVDSYYRKSKIFAFTSSSEGFPNVIGEAMSAGLPVISYDCVAGPSDLIDDGETGYLVPLFDDDEYSEKLMSLIENSSLREKMGRRASNKIEEFRSDKVAEEFYSFITEGN